MTAWLDLMGPVAWPLIACSVIGLAVSLERLWFFASTWRPALVDRSLLTAYASGDPLALEDHLARRRHPWQTGFRLLMEHELHPAALREEVLNLWLGGQRATHAANLRWLTIVAVVSPLLGLLGTVLGMMQSFAALVAHAGPVQPAVLADGLQQAMFTTVVGLVIAVPALTAVHVFRLWADARIARLQRLLNLIHLAISGASIGQRTGASDRPRQASSELGSRPA